MFAASERLARTPKSRTLALRLAFLFLSGAEHVEKGSNQGGRGPGHKTRHGDCKTYKFYGFYGWSKLFLRILIDFNWFYGLSIVFKGFNKIIKNFFLLLSSRLWRIIWKPRRFRRIKKLPIPEHALDIEFKRKFCEYRPVSPRWLSWHLRLLLPGYRRMNLWCSRFIRLDEL